MRRATVSNRSEPSSWRHFYPRSPCGERPTTFNGDFKAGQFLSTLSLRRATAIGRWGTGARDISIHALLAESDPPLADGTEPDATFLSTLSLRRATGCRCPPRHWHGGFLSTLSLRRATFRRQRARRGPQHFYPRSPCGERLLRRFPNMSLRIISIHALLAESDGGRCPPRHRHGRFLSTLSLRRATLSQDYTEQPTDISIHALLAESDLDALCARCPGLKFLSTLSLRRATVGQIACGEPITAISIHALLAESDSSRCGISARWTNFYPRSPCGERPPSANGAGPLRYFYPRSPCGERRQQPDGTTSTT